MSDRLTDEEIETSVRRMSAALPVLVARTLIAELAVTAILKKVARDDGGDAAINEYLKAVETELALNRHALTDDPYLASVIDLNFDRFKQLVSGEHLGLGTIFRN